jgi:uncharacterized MAPEG superfamily protein
MLLQACHLLNGQLSNSINLKSVLFVLARYLYIHPLFYFVPDLRGEKIILLGTNWSS